MFGGIYIGFDVKVILKTELQIIQCTVSYKQYSLVVVNKARFYNNSLAEINKKSSILTV